MISKNSASDSTYHARHLGRSLKRARRIAANIDAGSTLLDVGCNNGITSQFMLEEGVADTVTGIELHATTVENSLLENPRFNLIEGDIAKLELSDNYDVCIYGAVHHHILNFNGLGIAVQTLQKLAMHTNRILFFETGQISEGGRWDWQHAIRRYFRTDEEHFYYLFSSIEHLVESYSVIGKFWIHGIRRTFFRIDLKPRSERVIPVIPAKVNGAPTDTDTRLIRGFGSRDQRLVSADDPAEKDSPCMFWIRDDSATSKSFVKQHRHRPAAAILEWQIGQAMTNDWAVRPEATTELPGSLEFPYMEGASNISAFFNAPDDERRSIAEQLLRIFSDARKIAPNLTARVLLPAPKNSSALDLCDFNANNFLIVNQGDALAVRVVDFEQQSCQYSARNRLHLASMLSSLGQFRLRALREFMLGYVGLLVHLIAFQAKPIETRVRWRQPSALSVLVAELRTRAGAGTRFVLNAIGYG